MKTVIKRDSDNLIIWRALRLYGNEMMSAWVDACQIEQATKEQIDTLRDLADRSFELMDKYEE